ncbi:MAG: alkylmercury lyase family protein [Thermoplasmata archaeon]|nr:alkylmercury lyase family protein [Thermoplasmata archaeon]
MNSPRELRKYIFDVFLQTSRAPVVEEMMVRFHADRAEIVTRLRELESAHHILLLPGTERILMANPFSNLPTPFRVSAGGTQYFGNCAWDAIAFHVMLDQDVHVSSSCHHCGGPVELDLRGGRNVSDPAKNTLVFLGTPVSKWYDNLVATCSNTMVFFLSQDHLNEWKKAHPGWTGETLTVEKMIDVVTPISKGRTTLEYQMPPRSQLMAYWGSLGLRGPFWKF